MGIKHEYPFIFMVATVFYFWYNVNVRFEEKRRYRQEKQYF